MSTAASLTHLLSLTSEINRLVLEQTINASKMERASEQVTRYTKWQNDWDKAYDDAINGPSKDLKMNGNIFIAKDTPATKSQAIKWANYKAPHADEDKLEYLTEMDDRYTTQKEMLDTLIQKLQAEKDAEKQLVATKAADTGLLSGGGGG